MTRLSLIAALVLIGCVPKSVNQRIDALEYRVAQLETRPNVASRPDNGGEEAARAAASEIQKVWTEQGDAKRAKKLCADGAQKHGSTNAWRRSSRICDELEVVGKRAAPWSVDRWYQGGPPGDSEPVLAVFWEQWCPHCKREVPKLQAIHERYAGRLAVVGLTKVNRTSTDDRVVEFINSNGITYPMGKERAGELSAYYAVSGVPAAVIIQDGVVVWRGHPARLTDDAIERLLAGHGGGNNR